MAQKKKTEERTCDSCRFGPQGQSDDCDDCEDHDAWQPKEEANIDTKVHGERLIKGLDAINERHDNLPDDCKISVNGGPSVPFPSKEATEQVTEMVKEHLENSVVPAHMVHKVGNHELREFEDDTFSLDGGPRVSRVIMKKTIEAAGVLGGDNLLAIAKAGVEELENLRRKNNRQLDLSGNPLPDPEVIEDESTETKTYALYYSNGLKFRMGEEALDKALEHKKDEGISDRKDRMKLLVQNRSKVISGNKPLDPDRWDAGTKAIYERIMVGHGKDV